MLFLLTIVARAATAQAPDGARRFDVASIKPSRTGAVVQDARVNFPPGRFEALNVTVSDVLNGLNGYNGRVEGGPAWAQSDRYDILAKADGDLTPAERARAVLALLVGVDYREEAAGVDSRQRRRREQVCQRCA
jgi:hypothetical protein